MTWNSGEPPVEGYSNFLSVLIGALAFRLGGDPVIVLKALGVAGLAVSSLALFRLARRFLPPLGAAVPVVLSLGYVGTLLWAVSGLETLPYQALVLATIVFALVATEAGGRPGVAALCGACAGLLGLMRPEGAAVGLVIGSALWLIRPAQRGTLCACAAAGLAVYLPYSVWRWAYFGLLLPNSVRCKAFWDGDPWALIRGFWIFAWPYLLVALIPLAGRRDRRLLPLYGIPILYLGILYGVDPVVGHYNRHFLAALPCVLLLAVLGLHRILELSPQLGRNPLRDTLLAASVLGLGTAAFAPTRETLQAIVAAAGPTAQARSALGRYLGERLQPEDWYVLGDVGLAPYLAGGKVLDAFCLNSPELAQHDPDRYSRFAQLVYERGPRFLVMHGHHGDQFAPSGAVFAAIAIRPEFQRDYRWTATFSSADGPFHYWVFERRSP